MHVLYLDIDSLRADHVGAYGYEEETTPNIDKFAEDAVVFDRAYVANSPCLPSRAALLSGRYGLRNGIETHGPQSQQFRHPANEVDWVGTWTNHVPGRRWWSLPRLFYEERVPTFAVSSFPRHPAPWFHDTWHEIHQPQEPVGEGESFQTPRAESVVDAAIETIDRRDEQNSFTYVQLWDPHGPYNRTEEEVAEFIDISPPQYPTAEQIADHQKWDAWRSANHMEIDDRDDLRRMIANYNAEIHYADQQLGRLFDYLRTNGLYDESLIVVTADHGEEFGEHGLYREHWSTHDGTQRVPLLIKPPADTAVETGHRSQLVTNVDMAPTLADYAEFDAPTNWQGESVRPILQSSRDQWRDAIFFDHGLYTAQRALRTDRWKLVKTYHPGMWDGVVSPVELYDMIDDPWEQRNLADEKPDTASQLEDRLVRLVEQYQGSGEDSLRAVATRGPAGYRAFCDDFEGVNDSEKA